MLVEARGGTGACTNDVTEVPCSGQFSEDSRAQLEYFHFGILAVISQGLIRDWTNQMKTCTVPITESFPVPTQ